MIAYKGFNKDMTCQGFQYEEGKEYETDSAQLCESGFHACENPLDCFRYYAPGQSVYHKVELEDNGERNNDDTKVVGKKIKIGAKLSVGDICKLHFDFVKEHTIKENATSGDGAHAATSGNYAHAATSGNYAHAATSGNGANAATSGNYAHAATSGNGANAATSGNYAHAATSGNYAHAATSGDGSHAATSGNYAHAATSGNYVHAATSGNYAHAATSGNYAHAAVSGKDSVAAAIGKNSMAKASLGSGICLAEYGDWNGEGYPLLAVKAVIVDGEIIKADTWYKLENGDFVEVKDE